MVNVKLLLNLHFRETCLSHDNIQVSKNKEQGQECVEIFSYDASLKSAQFHPSDILSPSLELLECSKGLRFSLQEVNCFEAREVINEGDLVVIT